MPRARQGQSAFTRIAGAAIRAAAIMLGVVAQAAGMTRRFKIGDHVSWNSEAGRVSGIIVAVHIQDVAWKGYVHHATRADPQYEIKSDKTDHVALHKGSALKMQHPGQPPNT